MGGPGSDRWRRGTAVVLLCTFGLTACYRTGDRLELTPAPQTRVVIELTRPGADVMQDWIGAEPVAVEGTVLTATEDTITIAVERVGHAGAPSVRWGGESVAFPTSVVAEVRERELDRFRTGTLVAGFVAAASALAVAFVQFRGPGDGGDGGGPNPPQ